MNHTTVLILICLFHVPCAVYVVTLWVQVKGSRRHWGWGKLVCLILIVITPTNDISSLGGKIGVSRFCCLVTWNKRRMCHSRDRKRETLCVDPGVLEILGGGPRKSHSVSLRLLLGWWVQHIDLHARECGTCFPYLVCYDPHHPLRSLVTELRDGGVRAWSQLSQVY